MMTVKHFAMGAQIPKVIHQMVPCKNTLSDELRENIRSLTQLNKGWTHKLYDDNDLESIISNYYGEGVLHAYHKINWAYGAARSDFFRYLLLYAEGGVYLDIKSSVSRPLDTIIEMGDQYWLSKWDNEPDGRYPNWGVHAELADYERGEYQQWHIVSVPGHPFLRAVIDQVMGNIERYNILKDGVGRKGVLRTTGPIAYTIAIEQAKGSQQCSYKEVDVIRDFDFVYSLYEARPEGGNHQSLVKRHYSKLKRPVIKPAGLRDYGRMVLFYIRQVVVRVFIKPFAR